jgi:hypothetical protein
MDLAAPYLGQTEKTVDAPRVVQPVAVPAAEPEPKDTDAEAPPAEEPVAADEAQPSEQAEPKVAPVAAEDAGIVKFQVVSRPTGAFVSVNGKGAGRTPLELEYEVGTKLSLFSKARGYLARRQLITVEVDQAPVKLVLSPLPWWRSHHARRAAVPFDAGVSKHRGFQGWLQDS